MTDPEVPEGTVEGPVVPAVDPNATTVDPPPAAPVEAPKEEDKAA